MKLNLYLIVILMIVGCAQSKPGVQQFGVIKKSRDITKEEAVNFLNASEDYEASRQAMSSLDLPEGSASLGITNHPALVSNVEGKLGGFTIRAGESLLSVATRLRNAAGYSRLVYDMTNDAVSPDAVQSENRIETVGGRTLFGEIGEAFGEQIPGLKIYAAHDGLHMALVVSNKQYPRWKKLTVFDIKPGTLKANATALASSMGWQLDDADWKTDDYPIETRYPVVVSTDDIKQAMTAVLEDYPTRALLNPNTQRVTVVTRIQPYSKY